MQVAQASGLAEKSSNSRKAGGAAPKRKAPKAPVDPNAPKRPANPFFQFCQEQRTTVLESLVAQGHGEPSKQEVTKQLALRWNALSSVDKKVSVCASLHHIQIRGAECLQYAKVTAGVFQVALLLVTVEHTRTYVLLVQAFIVRLFILL